MVFNIDRMKNIWVISSLLLFSSLHSQKTLTLQRALQEASLNNAHLKTEFINVSIAQLEKLNAGIRPNPSLNNQSLFQIQPNYYNGNSTWHDPQNRQIWWQLTQPISVAGQRNNKIAVAESEFNFKKHEYLVLENSLLLEVSNQWFEIWAQTQKVKSLIKVLYQTDSLVEERSRTKDLPITTQMETIQYDIQRKGWLIALNEENQILKTQYLQLANITGIKDSFVIEETLDTTLQINKNLEGLISQSLEKRSEAVSAKLEIEAAKSNILLQKSLAIPQPELGFIWNPQNTFPYFGIYSTIKLPVFDRNQGQIKKAIIQENQAEAKQSELNKNIILEVTTAYGNFQMNRVNLKLQTEIYDQAMTLYNLQIMSYLKGESNVTQLMEMQESWILHENMLNEAKQHYRLSFNQLLYVSGLMNATRNN